MSELLGNWWPARGKNPHTCGWKPLEVGTTVKDLPAPKPQAEITTVEKDIIDKCVKKKGKPIKLKPIKLRYFKRPKPKPLVGSWRVWYQVSDVAKLTLEQADRLLTACPERGNKKKGTDHFDNWFGYEPRTLWVDITYPLGRGVCLIVKPVERKETPCKVCDRNFRKLKKLRKSGKKRKGGRPWGCTVMSPGIFMWAVAREYVRIYRNHKKYDVWGHAIGDLGFERIDIRKDGVVDLFIGS